MRIEDRRGEPLTETTVTVDDVELIEMLEGLADLAEGKREHVHFQASTDQQLVVRKGSGDDAEPLDRQMDWWVGPLVLFAVLFVVIGVITFVRWAVGLVT